MNTDIPAENQIRLKVSGSYALFTRPEMKVERVSYDTLTPSAARGILEAIYWKPQFRWIIDTIYVLNPIRFTNIRRNELGTTIPCQGKVRDSMTDRSIDPTQDINEHRQQRAAMVLKNVTYIIEAHPHILDLHMEKGGPASSKGDLTRKHLDIFYRRASEGQRFHQPYLGCREFPVEKFELLKKEEEIPAPHEELAGEKDLSYMLHDIEFDQNPKTKMVKKTNFHFFRATLRDGMLEVPPLPFAP